MPSFVQLPLAAERVGKSEVTLRRLVKSGKVGHRKEKTLTGFIYLVDVDEITSYYGGSTASETKEAEPKKGPVVEEVKPSPDAARRGAGTNAAMRVSVAEKSGELATYWQARAELYEGRYQEAVEVTGKLREELGAWRGKAEQAQEMVKQLLPATTSATAKKTEDSKLLVWTLSAITAAAGLATVGFIAWAVISLR